MHELSIIEGIIHRIDVLRKEHNFLKVKEIVLKSGKYNCLSEQNLQFCFEAITGATYMEGARIKVNRPDDKDAGLSNAVYLDKLEVEYGT